MDPEDVRIGEVYRIREIPEDSLVVLLYEPGSIVKVVGGGPQEHGCNTWATKLLFGEHIYRRSMREGGREVGFVCAAELEPLTDSDFDIPPKKGG